MSAMANCNLTAWGGGGVGKWSPHPHIPTSPRRFRSYFPNDTPAVIGTKLVDPPLSRMLTQDPSSDEQGWSTQIETPRPTPKANLVSSPAVPGTSTVT